MMLPADLNIETMDVFDFQVQTLTKGKIEGDILKGSVTHLHALQISVIFLLQVASAIKRILSKFKSSKPFSLGIRNKTVTQIFF